MKALIFNSGFGHRLLPYTENHPKCMTPLLSGETIFERELRLLHECGVDDVVVTTGPFAEQLHKVAGKIPFSAMRITFVHNDRYLTTNYIVSMLLAGPHLRGEDVLMMHGDLVFSKSLLRQVIDSPEKNLVCVNPGLPLPEKDFVGWVDRGFLKTVKVGDKGPDRLALQPLYKLSKESFGLWMAKVEEFVASGNDRVYAENALNEISDILGIRPFDYSCEYINEIDDESDFNRVRSEIVPFDYRDQRVEEGASYEDLFRQLDAFGAKKPLFVVDRAFAFLPIKEAVESRPNALFFSDFSPNPTLEETEKAYGMYMENGCDCLVCVGGGTAIDIGKNVKNRIKGSAYGGSLAECCGFEYADYPVIPLIAIPTTSGTGSESTHFAVEYVDHVKRSNSHPYLLPNLVFLFPELTFSVPASGKASTMADAFCQCVESLWAKQGNQQSRGYAKEGIKLFLTCYMGALSGDEKAMACMQKVANLSGRAINISTTTAAHALSYGITSKYGIPHGKAVGMVFPDVLALNLARSELEAPWKVDLAELLSCEVDELHGRICGILRYIIDDDKLHPSKEDVASLMGGVNAQRLGNNPVSLSEQDIAEIYESL